MTKKELRALMKAREKEFLCSGAAHESSEKVWAHVEALDAFRDASCVLCYMSIPGEVETPDFISRWHGRKRMVIPRVVGDDLELFEYDPQKLVPGYLGILEPSSDALCVDPSEVDLALVPGVGFCVDTGACSVAGKVLRMGHGKGFYDRLLPSLRCPTVGICFNFRLVDEIPSDPWDRPLDALVCESGLA